MIKLGIILNLTLIILAGVWVWNNRVESNQVPRSQIQQKQFTKQSDDQGEIIVGVMPVSLESGKEVKFEVIIDTHSKELDFDLLKLAVLNDGEGNSLKPLSWNGGSGGHHLKGELIFPKISGGTKAVKLTIAAIEGIDRKFKWNL